MASRAAIVGIDFGTTFSSVGVWSNDHVEIASNAQGDRVTPSVVAFTDDERLLGDEAMAQVHHHLSFSLSRAFSYSPTFEVAITRRWEFLGFDPGFPRKKKKKKKEKKRKEKNVFF